MSVDWIIDVHPVLESTQDIIKTRACEGKPEGCVVQAHKQTAGRGRHGRAWQGGKGNLYLSLLLRPECAVSRIGELSFCPALAALKTIEDFCVHQDGLSLKWPNDVLINQKKCAGILIESGLSDDGRTVDWVALGIGVNIKSAPPDMGAAVQTISAKELSADNFRECFLSHLSDIYIQWQVEGFVPIRNAWMDYGHRKGDAILVKPGNAHVRGAFEDIDNCGSLILRDETGKIIKITSGDVYLV